MIEDDAKVYVEGQLICLDLVGGSHGWSTRGEEYSFGMTKEDAIALAKALENAAKAMKND